jgi:hypothetical protein
VTEFVADLKYVSKPAMGAINTLDPTDSCSEGAASAEVVIARTANTPTREATIRLNIRATLLVWNGPWVRLMRGTEGRSVACGRAQESLYGVAD